MAAIVHHAALGLSLAALTGAGVRAASLAAPDGLERTLAAVVLTAAAAVAEALGLGLIGLGTHPVVLTIAALATWLAARLWLPAPQLGVGAELGGWWGSLRPAARCAAAGLVGAGLGWTAWLLVNPSIGIDGVVEHLTEIAGWVHSGHPGTVQNITYVFPVGSYPVTEEVLLAWASGISRSFVPAALSTPAALGLLVLAGWLGLRTLSVPRGVSALALAALATAPLPVEQVTGPNTDLPAVAWLVSTAALCAASARRPALLAPAVVAAGLAVGTKTTALPLAALVLVLAGLRARPVLRRLVVPLGMAIATATVVGGTWYLRNLFDHGWPFWPFTAAPWGDRVPRYLALQHFSILERPRATLSGRWDLYVGTLAGYLLLFAGAFAVPLAARRRVVWAGAVVAGLALLIWAGAPFTGIGDDPRLNALSLSALRYLMPAAAAAALALALAARTGRRLRLGVSVLLAAAVSWNVARNAELGYPFFPDPWWLAAGGAVGALLAIVLPKALAVARLPSLSGLRAGVIATAAGACLAAAATGYVQRHGKTHATFDAKAALWFGTQPAFRNGSAPVSAAESPPGVLAGDGLAHRVDLIPTDETCARVVERARRGWVLLRQPTSAQDLLPKFTAAGCLAGHRPVYADDQVLVFRLG
ncbi:MAG: hypothetical protein M3Z33_00490 [Actinomycetota bacterium]|nr:hypothetical protein [Actinomycetota bacterium]